MGAEVAHRHCAPYTAFAAPAEPETSRASQGSWIGRPITAIPVLGFNMRFDIGLGIDHVVLWAAPPAR
ncbi:hypothetical protein ACFQ9U_29545 [Streptomyces sp. NPDC056568]|uniref:hypothetical protein n=1 Tax=Streptomyces sp. NPDC056568 TaxID=3345866 RepID=UPI0036CB8B6D